MTMPVFTNLGFLLSLVMQTVTVSTIEGVPPQWKQEAQLATTSQPLPDDPAQAAQEAGNRLTSFLADQGYLAVRADVIKLDDGSLKLAVTPGNRFKLRVIQITGNRALPAARLRTALNLPTGDWLYHYRLDKGLDDMLLLYSSRGYIRACADYKVMEERVQRDVSYCRLYIAIDEGRQFHISNVTFLDMPSNLTDPARHATDLHIGEVFQPETIYAASTRLRKYFLDNGYPFTEVRLITQPNDESATVDVGFSVSINEQYTVLRHEIVGNKGLSSLAIIPYLQPLPGELYNDDEVRSSLRLLRRQPAIADAKVEEIARDGVLRWRITERPATSVSGALGYQPSSEALAGAMSLQSVNLLGGGEQARLQGSRQSVDHSAGELYYRHPRLASPQSFAEGTGSYIDDTQYRKWELEAGVGTELWEALEGTVGGLGGRTWNQQGHSTKQGVYSELELTAITPLENPRTGWEGTTRAEWSVKDIRENRGKSRRMDIPKLSGELWRHFPLGGPLVLSLRAEAKSVVTDLAVPRDEWWLVGGLAGPRGYMEQSIAGTEMSMGTLEVRYLLGGVARLFAFGDVAQVRLQPNPANVYPGYGVGLVAGSELGNWTIAFALGKNDTLLTGKVHIGFAAWF
jgi:outer membrane protein assembly factor BamA